MRTSHFSATGGGGGEASMIALLYGWLDTGCVSSKWAFFGRNTRYITDRIILIRWYGHWGDVITMDTRFDITRQTPRVTFFFTDIFIFFYFQIQRAFSGIFFFSVLIFCVGGGAVTHLRSSASCSDTRRKSPACSPGCPRRWWIWGNTPKLSWPTGDGSGRGPRGLARSHSAETHL